MENPFPKKPFISPELAEVVYGGSVLLVAVGGLCGSGSQGHNAILVPAYFMMVLLPVAVVGVLSSLGLEQQSLGKTLFPVGLWSLYMAALMLWG